MDIFKVALIYTLVLLLLWCECGASLYYMGDFDAHVEDLLRREMLEPTAVDFIQRKSTEQLQTTFGARWNGSKVFPFGSLVTGLAAKNSDADFYVEIPNYDETKRMYYFQEAAKLLHQEPEKYTKVELRLEKAVPIIRFYNTVVGMSTDVSFKGESIVDITRLLRYYFNLDKRFIPLIAIIKYWCKFYKLTSKYELKNYALYIMVIFYLQQKNVVPSVYQLQAHLPPYMVKNWNMNFEEIHYKIQNNECLFDLLGGFFVYYSEFNFKNYCVSPFAGWPVPKIDFEVINKIPKEFSMYKNKMEAGDVTPVSLHRVMCVQNIFEHDLNPAWRVTEKNIIKFATHARSAAKMYKKLPSDQFFKYIFTEEKYNHTLIMVILISLFIVFYTQSRLRKVLSYVSRLFSRSQ